MRNVTLHAPDMWATTSADMIVRAYDSGTGDTFNFGPHASAMSENLYVQRLVACELKTELQEFLNWLNAGDTSSSEATPVS